ncbi:MAG: BMA_0021/BMA_0022 family TOMM bacteriocin [Myxococcota bacterium]
MSDEKNELTTSPVGVQRHWNDYSAQATKAFLEWGGVWEQAIALAWWDEAFKKKLLAHPRKALLDTLQYKVPPFIDLKIIEVPEGEGWGWRPLAKNEIDKISTPPPGYRHIGGSNKRLNVHGGWWDLPNFELQVPLPPKPPEDQIAVALAAFSYQGRAYPFTCFCFC